VGHAAAAAEALLERRNEPDVDGRGALGPRVRGESLGCEAETGNRDKRVREDDLGRRCTNGQYANPSLRTRVAVFSILRLPNRSPLPGAGHPKAEIGFYAARLSGPSK
jgi:hypothetical protein